MTYLDVLDYPVKTKADMARAIAGFSYAKHGVPDSDYSLEESIDQKINGMSNLELIDLWSRAEIEFVILVRGVNNAPNE